MKKLLLSQLASLVAIGFSFAQTIDLVTYADGFSEPVDIKHAGDDRLFVVEKDGTIKIITGKNQIQSQNFLDISSKVLNGSESGLLGLAFHPDYANNGLFYVNYIRRANGNGTETVIAEYKRTNATTADSNSEKILLTYPQPAGNHNGGSLLFGPDKKLYVSSGDGGRGGDYFNNGQNKNSPLAAILRLDVDNSPSYIPADNPFVGRDGNDYIWHYGLRNPWKFSFDKQTSELWIADVGDNDNLSSEEVNKVSGTTGGLNFGWPCYEGNNPFKTAQCNSSKDGLIFPVNEYDRRNGRCSITGGYVYRGSKYPELNGKYIYTDYCSGEIFTVNTDGSNFTATSFFSSFAGLSTFGQSITNELFVASLSGTIYEVTDKDQTLNVSEFEKLDINISQNNKLSQLYLNGISNENLKGLSLINISGQNVLDLTKNKVSENSYNVADVSDGVYILLIETTNNNKKAVKVLIQ